MKILVVGSGGREHAIIHKLLENKEIEKIWCAPGNGGIASEAECVDIKATDVEGMVKFAKEKQADFCVVTPDDPLALGMVDEMEKQGIPCFGPKAKAAVIEASKAFSKNLMKKYGIPTADYQIFDDAKKALQYIEEKNTFPIVLKADGLALGKGVLIAESLADAKAAIRELMIDRMFGTAGNTVVVEEFMEGPEVSVLAFTDSKVIRPMISSMDHKRADDHDEGLNTGGMGTIAPSPYYTEKIAQQCMDEIFLPTMYAMNAEDRAFKGCLYFGLMLTETGPRVVEYNCRFGDPETQVVLPLLKGDLYTIMKACHDETLDKVKIDWSDEHCACVIEASGGYPVKYTKGYEIHGLDEHGQHDDVYIYHAGTKLENGKYYTNGGRVLGVTALGNTLDDALKTAYSAVDEIGFENMHCRRDIGRK
ncbi:MAG: phosphoribosylamine--glycine ligase [Solobacterium sp.]|jgi:phosphoribosylamine--glycine ligase|nr:phosphoribosylamine--glycine ligase [Solobacterium sp.]MCH4205893.1 phosphoribosylamine--glycine ligase [Solobacterium sp.]MCH4227322.1 phosphoribosylamine--glycine ligase [Solobacterium sp.]MCH4282681.1 phosphoribosylamine--glycine ligase [Solobacterium sp.]